MAGASDNGDWSEGGSPDDLPDFPEEWGVIVIPDDLSELSDEVEAVRAEMRVAERPTRWRRLMNRPGVRRFRRLALAALRAPVLIVSMALLVTVASLVASAWPGPPRQPVTQRSGSDELDALPGLDGLVDDTGKMVQLKADLPAVVMITDDCNCGLLITDTVAATAVANRTSKKPIAVVVITSPQTAMSPARASGKATAPATQAVPPTAVPTQPTEVVLHEPRPGYARDQFQVPAAPGTAAVFAVNDAGHIVGSLPKTMSVSEIVPELAQL